MKSTSRTLLKKAGANSQAFYNPSSGLVTSNNPSLRIPLNVWVDSSGNLVTKNDDNTINQVSLTQLSGNTGNVYTPLFVNTNDYQMGTNDFVVFQQTTNKGILLPALGVPGVLYMLGGTTGAFIGTGLAAQLNEVTTGAITLFGACLIFFITFDGTHWYTLPSEPVT